MILAALPWAPVLLLFPGHQFWQVASGADVRLTRGIGRRCGAYQVLEWALSFGANTGANGNATLKLHEKTALQPLN